MSSSRAVMQQVIENGSLPTLSKVASALFTLTGREGAHTQDISRLIAQDVSLTSKLLKVVNSSFYNYPSQIRTIQQAVAILGSNAVRSLVLSFSFLEMERPPHGKGFDFERFWEESLAAGVAARLIMAEVSDRDPEDVFTSALLQKIGKLIMASTFRELYDELLAEADGSEDSLLTLEQARFGATHTEIGAEAARFWNFPDSLAIPIAWHQNPAAWQGEDPRLQQDIRICHLAALLARIMYSGKPVAYHGPFCERARTMLRLDNRTIDRLLAEVGREVARVGDYFGFKVRNASSIPELLQRANIELSLLNMSYEQKNRELVQAKLKLEQLTAELEEKNAYLERLANLDGLTGIYNHRYFQEYLNQEIERSQRLAYPLCLILADIDRFKVLNDDHGHQAGDAVLKEVARLCGSIIGEHDLIARYGGEEFVFVLPEMTLEDALSMAETIRATVAGSPFYHDLERHQVTISLGVAQMNDQDENEQRTKTTLIDRADRALYAAKKRGGNRVEYKPDKPGWFSRAR